MNERTCPVCNEEIKGAGIKVKAGNREMTVCCEDCARKAKERPAQYATAGK